MSTNCLVPCLVFKRELLPIVTDLHRAGCYGYRYHLGPPCKSKLARILADQCKQNPYRDQFW